MARPTIMIPELIDKLRQAFLIGATDEEACAYAGISKQTLYNYQNRHPEFLDQKMAWKKQPILKAKMTVVKALDKPEHAKWYLERKSKDEFSLRREVTGKDGEAIQVDGDVYVSLLKTLDKILPDEDISKDTSQDS